MGRGSGVRQNGAGDDLVPLAHDPATKREPRMLTSDLALRVDPAYEKISRRFYENPEEFADAFARAWFKLTHRDMGSARPLPRTGGAGRGAAVAGPAAGRRPRADRRRRRRSALKQQVLDSGLTTAQLVATTWAAASSFRGSDKRGGVNGARIRLAPQKDWEVNNPTQLATVLETLEGIQTRFNQAQTGGKRVSAGRPDRAGRERGGRAGRPRRGRRRRPCRSTPGRTDASQEQTDVESFGYLEPAADGFRSYAGKYASCRRSTCWSTGPTC